MLLIKSESSEEGFNLFTDIKSKIKHHKRIAFFLLPVSVLNIVVGFSNLINYGTKISYVNIFLGSLVMYQIIKHFKNYQYKNKNISTDQIHNGLYRVVLKYPRETFFREFHPFKFHVLNNSFYFNLEKNQTIELLLFKNEIDYYQKFFSEIDILEGAATTIANNTDAKAVITWVPDLMDDIDQAILDLKALPFTSYKIVHWNSTDNAISYMNQYTDEYPNDNLKIVQQAVVLME